MNELERLSQQAGEILLARKLRVVTAESCTGGWLAKCITDIAGSSQWFERGFITYTNEAKQQMLDVRAETLQAAGAVSEDTVTEMAHGALAHSNGDLAVAISGIAGPGGAVAGKPVGTVCFAWLMRNGTASCSTRHFQGDRDAVRRQSVSFALAGIPDVLES